MNSKVLILIIGCFIVNTIGYGQYFSGVIKGKDGVVNGSDSDVQIASMYSVENLKKHLSILASDSLEGRETGQKGLQLAGDFISKYLSKLGLQPNPQTNSYLQPIAFTYSKWVDTDLYVNGKRFKLMWDYLAFPEQNENAPLIKTDVVTFLGYGISDRNYNDYKKVKVKDKVIIINEGEPIAEDGRSFITKDTSLSSWSSDITKKLKVAKENGVKLVLIITKDFKKLTEENRKKFLSPFLQLGNLKDKPLETANYAYISSDIAKEIFGAQEAKILKARKKIAKGKPANVILPNNFIMNMSKEVKTMEGNNVMGFIEGKSKKDEIIIVSAHYDHLGKKGDEIFNGADDNGSGTVTLMELARLFQTAVNRAERPERSIAFVWVAGEEKGLLGSKYYVNNPVFPLDKTMVDVNIDMVGRIDDVHLTDTSYVYVIGSDRLSKELDKVVVNANLQVGLTLDYKYNSEEDPNKYYYRSDHYNFAERGIPSVFFFSGVHQDYHMPGDDVEKIHFNLMRQRGELFFYTIWNLANQPNSITRDDKM
ncbi:MAG: M28 family peptidase [Saprospiraceae bacterium]|nr:M28 family peptidase [Saprospiraceae bacterium]